MVSLFLPLLYCFYYFRCDNMRNCPQSSPACQQVSAICLFNWLVLQIITRLFVTILSFLVNLKNAEIVSLFFCISDFLFSILSFPYSTISCPLILVRIGLVVLSKSCSHQAHSQSAAITAATQPSIFLHCLIHA